jgi:glutamate-1-semialdehyde 2,1-aminomutase
MYMVNENDRILAAELNDFLPKSVYDMHMHIYRTKDLGLAEDSTLYDGRETEGIESVKDYYLRLLPDTALIGGLALGFPTVKCDKEAVNSFVSDEVQSNSTFKGSVCIDPSDEASARRFVDANPNIIGLKPYHLFADRKETWNAEIEEYLPEWAFRLADEKGLLITLHMVKDGAIADLNNQETIKKMCEKYPNAKLILAHAARCFNSANAVKGLASLEGLANVWFDSSAICETEPLLEILRRFGPERLVWGSDYPVCCTRGRAVTMGLDFIWLQEDTVNWGNLNTKCRAVVVGLESLRALKSACRYAGLDKREIDDIFTGNAKRLLGIK